MTYYLSFGVLLAAVAVGIWVRPKHAFAGTLMIIAGCIGSVVCLGWQVRQSLFMPAVREPDRGQAVVGYFLANQLLAEIGNAEGRVLLFFPPDSVIDEEAVGTYAGTFKRVLRGFPRLEVQVLTLDVPRKAAKGGQIPLSAFRQVASNAPTAVAAVSFAGVPADIQDFLLAKDQSPPAFFVFDPWSTTNWLAAVKSGRVRCAIVLRPGMRPPSSEAISGEPREVFERFYLMATRANAEEIAGKLTGK